MDQEKNLIETKVESKEIFDGTVLHVFRDEVALPNGHSAVREVIRHVGAVTVLPVDDEGNAYVERQFRYPMDRVITEVPAGKLDSPDEDPLEAAKRELREETGLSAGRWTFLGQCYAAPAYCDEVLSFYLAEDLSFGETDRDEDEFLSVQKVPLTDLVNMIMDGEIRDSKTQLIILKAARLYRI